VDRTRPPHDGRRPVPRPRRPGHSARDDVPARDDEAPAETFMRLGPATVRPSEELAPLLERMREAKVTTILVATAEGRYVGAVNHDDGEAFIRERQAGPRKPHAVL
jgi:CBS domain-containing protein